MRITLGLLLAAFLLAFPATAGAHALLEETVPASGAVVERQPKAVKFAFSEPVEGAFGAVRVYDAEGERADEGSALRPGDDPKQIGVPLRPELPDGTYTATYRVVSADSHVISGGFVFSIGEAGAAPRETVAELIGAGASGPVSDLATGIFRVLLYAALALGVGGVVFLLTIWLPGAATVRRAGGGWEEASVAFLSRLRAALLLAAILGVLGAAGGVVMQGAEAAGVSGFSALRGSILGEVLETRFGTYRGLAVLAWLAFGLLVALLLRPSRSAPRSLALAALAAPLAFLVLVPALSGHPSVQPPVAVLFPTNVIHVLTMATWLGGLAALLFAVPGATRRLAGSDGARLLAALLTRFSRLAIVAVALLAVTGLIQAYVLVRDPSDLLDTAYGRAVLIKISLLALVVAIAAYLRRRALPRLQRVAADGASPGQAGLLLRRALRAEVGLLLVVLGVTAALASYAPPISAQAGPYSADAVDGRLLTELTVDPARPGLNEVHVYLFDARTGVQFKAAKEVTVGATLPAEDIGPLELELRPAGPGHYVAPSASLGVTGEWTLGVVVRVSAFDQYESEFEVPIE